jgi:hypothetical protein
VVKTSGLDGIAVGVVDLHLESLRGPAHVLIFGVKIDAAVGAGSGHDVYFEIEVLEVVILNVADVEAVGTLAVGNDGAILDGERGLVFIDLSSGEVFTVEEGDPAVLGWDGGDGKQEQQGGAMHMGAVYTWCERAKLR